MTSSVDICNLGLSRLGSKPITTLLEDSPAGRACNRIYERVKNAELRAYAWNFAKSRASIAASSEAPAFGFAYKYQVPADFLRLLPDRDVSDWCIEGRYILTNDNSPLEIKYIQKVNDENQFDEMFIDHLANRIARDLAEPLTQSNSKVATAEAKYKASQAVARKMNSFENLPKQPPTDTWILARL
jgi:hypothetical protein